MRIMTIRSRALLFASAIIAAAAVSAMAQGGAQQDFSKVEIKTTKIAGNFYTLDGQGGRIGALAGPDGVFLVDSQYAPLTEKIVTAVRSISNAQIRFLVNTHVHADHTGGNENFGRMGVVLFSRDQLRARLAKPAGNASPAPPAALPTVTYDGPVTLHINGEEVQLLPIRQAHTDGDTLVRFPGLDVLMTGDYFRSVGYPNIDRANGGTLNGMLEGLDYTIGLAGPNTKVIPGHGPIVDRAALIAHRDMILAIRDRVAQLVKQGKTAPEVLAAKPTADYDSRIEQGNPTAERFVNQLYATLAGAN